MSIDGLKLSKGIEELYLSGNANVDIFLKLGAKVMSYSNFITIKLNDEIIEQFNAMNYDKVDINSNTNKHK